MTKKEIFATIKEANQIADQMNGLDIKSAKYLDLSDDLNATLDPLFFNKRRNYSVLLSERTGHYYVKFW